MVIQAVDSQFHGHIAPTTPRGVYRSVAVFVSSDSCSTGMFHCAGPLSSRYNNTKMTEKVRAQALTGNQQTFIATMYLSKGNIMLGVISSVQDLVQNAPMFSRLLLYRLSSLSLEQGHHFHFMG